MDYHLDYGIRLNTKPEYERLYRWAINEVGPDGSLIGEDQILWHYPLYFSATSCVLTNHLKIEPKFSPTGEIEETPQIKAGQTILMTLRPGDRVNGEFIRGATFSMFGTKRSVQDFTLEIHSLEDSTELESCSAWGRISHECEIYFRNRTSDDCICFLLYVNSEKFKEYSTLIQKGEIDNIIFHARSSGGFYSYWNPSISTHSVKVLLSSDQHKFDLPPDFEPPRLGRMAEAGLLLRRHLEFSKDDPSPPAIDGGGEPTPPANSTVQVTSEIDPRLLPILASLKRAAWVAVALLAAIAAIALQKH